MGRNSDQEAEIAAAQDDYNQRLAVAVLRDAIADEGVGYVLTRDGQFWLDVAGVEPESVEHIVGHSLYLDPYAILMEARVR